ncbi:MAG: FtsX-like permease family protein, partial [Bacteroidota bacterium]
AIFIACMGLFGLAAITTERKIKEVGIRKILGASKRQIMFQLSRNFAVLVAISFLVFSPFTYLVMSGWLENFAYRISISPLVFLLGGILALVIAVVTISYHTLRSASRNPVDALRYE